MKWEMKIGLVDGGGHDRISMECSCRLYKDTFVMLPW